MGVPVRGWNEAGETRAGIAILGGTFDPPHRAHVRLLATARQRLPVAELRVVVAGDHPHKHDARMTPAPHRLAMCRLAFAALPGVVVDDRELRRPGPSYTVDTLVELRREHPGRPLFFLIGSDNLPLLPSWREHHRILALATVVTFPRAGYPVDAAALAPLDLETAERERLLANVLPLPGDDVAATTIRARFGHGAGLDDVDPAVADYIRAHGLYRP